MKWKKIRGKENKKKSIFSFYMFGWRENEEKMRVIMKWHIYPYNVKV